MQQLSTLFTTGGEITRIWHVVGNNTVILLRHFPLTGEWTVTANGVQQPALEFKLPSTNHVCKVEFVPQGSTFAARAGLSGFTYTCFVDGVKIPENLEKMSASHPLVAPAESNVMIDERVIVAGDLAAWYRIKRPNSGSVAGVDIHRRFRDFYFLYAQVCSAFRGTHLYASIPVPPPKEIPLISNHLNVEFLQERRVRLQAWLQKLLTLPGIAGGLNPDVQEFLGLGGPEGVREISHVFFGKTLGMRLTRPQPVGSTGEGQPIQSAFSVQVVEVLPMPTTPDPTQAQIYAGDMITRITGESALMQSYDAALNLLRTAPRPLVVHFLGIRKGSDGHSTIVSMLEKPMTAAVLSGTGASTIVPPTTQALPPPPPPPVKMSPREEEEEDGDHGIGV